MKAIKILLLPTICMIFSLSCSRKTRYKVGQFYQRNYIVNHFYLYRKYKDSEKTNQTILCAVYQDLNLNAVSLQPTDRGFDNPAYPEFVNSDYYFLKDSSIFLEWPKDYTHKVLDFNASPGDTIASGLTKDFYYLEDVGIYSQNFTYFLLNTLTKKTKRKIKYVHNLGFVSEERLYNDSIIKWELESISGTPLASFIKEAPGFRYFPIIDE